MKRKSELLFWRSEKSWYSFDKESNSYVLTDKAPERAKKSFEAWKKHNKI